MLLSSLSKKERERCEQHARRDRREYAPGNSKDRSRRRRKGKSDLLGSKLKGTSSRSPARNSKKANAPEARAARGGRDRSGRGVAISMRSTSVIRGKRVGDLL